MEQSSSSNGEVDLVEMEFGNLKNLSGKQGQYNVAGAEKQVTISARVRNEIGIKASSS